MKIKKGKKAFTLIELLAVIIILSIISLIVGVVIGNIIDNAKKEAYKESVRGMIKAAENYIGEYPLKHGKPLRYPVEFTCDGNTCSNDIDNLTFTQEIPKSGKIVILSAKLVKASYISNDRYCVTGPKENLQIAKSCTDIDDTIPRIAGTQEGDTLHLTLIDEESGISGYCVTNANNSSNCSWVNTENANVDHVLSTSGTYYAFARDKKNNISESIEFVTGDIEKPIVTAELDGKIIDIEVSDNASVVEYCVTNTNDLSSCTWNTISENSFGHILSEAGTYYVFAKDSSGNISDSVNVEALTTAFCAYQPDDVVETFAYTGAMQSFTVPCDGIYKLEVWGAQGANYNATGGKGGYSYGNIILAKDDSLTVAVGGTNSTFNGGGSGTGKGGGATHIAKYNSSYTTLSSYGNTTTAANYVYLVAGGGGGGGGGAYTTGTRNWATGGAGGGTSGENGISADDNRASSGMGNGIGATQTTGAAFGAGGSGAAGGGGGWYGGTGSSGYNGTPGGGGGSGWLSSQLSIGTTGMTSGAQSSHGQARITFIGPTYTIYFDANGGNVDIESKEVEGTNNVAGELPVPTKEGKIFWGWYTDTTYTTFVSPSTRLTDNMTVYARWADDTIEFATSGINGTFISVSGTYKLEVWGSQGASYNAAGGKGGYSTGTVELNAGDYLQVVTGSNTGYNGGGFGTGKGGGATHIAKLDANYTTLSSYANATTAANYVYLVAGGGGGGGGGAYSTGTRNWATGGAGGGTSGKNGISADDAKVSSGKGNGVGATQTSGAAFGAGGSGAAGGGGGWYGGTGSSGYNGTPGGGGGSGWIGGVTNGSTIAGNASMPTYDGTSTMTGNSGNGYAKITLISY